MGKVGGKRPGAGRPKGSLNKRTYEVRARLKELGCDPIAVLAGMVEDASLDIELRRRAASDLLPYTAPRLAAQHIEHSGAIDSRGVAVTADRTLPDEWEHPSEPTSSPRPN